MKQFLKQLDYIYKHGRQTPPGRTAQGTRKVFGLQTRYPVSHEAFPMITSKYVNFNNVWAELLWFIRGETNSKTLEQMGCNIWRPWAYKGNPERMQHWREHIASFWDMRVQTLAPIRRELLSCFEDEAQRLAIINTMTNVPTHERVQKLEELGVFDRILASTLVLYQPRAVEPGELGPVYGKQWRAWEDVRLIRDAGPHSTDLEGLGYSLVQDSMVGEGLISVYRRQIDQLQEVVDGLRANPTSRRHIISAWNPGLTPVESADHGTNIENGFQVLPPCHALIQFNAVPLTETERESTGKEYGLSLMLTQRSMDCPVGAPYNVPSYSLLLAIIAQIVDMVPMEFIHSVGDAHIYDDQIEGVERWLKLPCYKLPQLWIDPNVRELSDLTFESVCLENYEHGPIIKFKVAV